VQIAEGCARVMSEQVEGLVTMCLQGLRDPHAKVRGNWGILVLKWTLLPQRVGETQTLDPNATQMLDPNPTTWAAHLPS
jgi:hypothetical protein